MNFKKILKIVNSVRVKIKYSSKDSYDYKNGYTDAINDIISELNKRNELTSKNTSLLSENKELLTKVLYNLERDCFNTDNEFVEKFLKKQIARVTKKINNLN